MNTRIFSLIIVFLVLICGSVTTGGLQAQIYLPGKGPEDYKEPTLEPGPIFEGSEFIFEGVIIDQTCYKDSSIGIATAYQVEILHKFKGDGLVFPGTVTLIQMGGRVGMEGSFNSHQMRYGSSMRYIFYCSRTKVNYPSSLSSNSLQLSPWYSIRFNPGLNFPYATGFGVHFQNHIQVYDFINQYGKFAAPNEIPPPHPLEHTRQMERDKINEKKKKQEEIKQQLREAKRQEKERRMKLRQEKLDSLNRVSPENSSTNPAEQDSTSGCDSKEKKNIH